MEETSPQHAAARYLLAAMLERKRLLKEVESKTTGKRHHAHLRAHQDRRSLRHPRPPTPPRPDRAGAGRGLVVARSGVEVQGQGGSDPPARHPEPHRCSWKWGAHAPSRAVFGASPKTSLAVRSLTGAVAVVLPGLSGGGAGQGTRGRVRSPFRFCELHRSGSGMVLVNARELAERVVWALRMPVYWRQAAA